MYNSNIPSDRDLPTTGKLIKSTFLAVVAAGALLITVVLPSEYGIDPTGVGQMLGLKKMGDIKMSLAAEVAADKAKDHQADQKADIPQKVVEIEKSQNTATENINQDVMTVTLAPNQGKEIKAKMKKGAVLTYKWMSDGGKTNFDVHADSEALNINYHNYEKGTEKIKEGTITAAFEGYHGWYWRNRTEKTLTVTIEVNGDYEYLKRIE